MTDQQTLLDNENADFWNTLCGSVQAQSLGVTDSSKESLKRFDDWYFDMYPYLEKHIPFENMADKAVLEIGLGYGTVSQRIALAGAVYSGLDIAPGPVAMANDRMGQHGLPARAVCASVLNAPFDDDTFDYVVSIGCLHHTGNLQRALDEVWRILKPGGSAVIMVYNALSYRRWHQAAEETRRYFLWDYLGIGKMPEFDAKTRHTYDSDIEGRSAPETSFVSMRHLRRMCSKFETFAATLENIEQEVPYLDQTRVELLRTDIPATLGLDIYATARK